MQVFNKSFSGKSFASFNTGKVHRFDRWFLDWTNECKSCLPNTAKAATDKTATAVKCFIDWTRYVNCSGSLKLGWFGY